MTPAHPDRTAERPLGDPHPRSGGWAALVLLLAACDPTLVVGSSTCTPALRAGDEFQPGVATDDPVAMPWSTDFESGFCDYALSLGFCYADPDASFEVVDGPARSGRRSAAFTISPDTVSARQTRCVREGVMPVSASYGAWYYLPVAPTMSDNWNLMHFNGYLDAGGSHGLWDVSLRIGDDGLLHLFVRDFLGSTGGLPDVTVEAPVGQWFHIEFVLRRAADMTGGIALRQDGQELFARDSIVTDDTDWGQWYVGNLAVGLTPSDSTVYVDDISIRRTP